MGRGFGFVTLLFVLVVGIWFYLRQTQTAAGQEQVIRLPRLTSPEYAMICSRWRRLNAATLP